MKLKECVIMEATYIYMYIDDKVILYWLSIYC